MAIDDFTLARVVHVAAVVGWVGALWFVSLSLLPTLKASGQIANSPALLRPLARRLARQARWWLGLIGFSGLWLVWRGDLWSRYAEGRFWWMHLMTAVWAIFALILFVLEPLAGSRPSSGDTARDFAKEASHHRKIGIVALVTLAASLAGAHGLF